MKLTSTEGLDVCSVAMAGQSCEMELAGLKSFGMDLGLVSFVQWGSRLRYLTETMCKHGDLNIGVWCSWDLEGAAE